MSPIARSAVGERRRNHMLRELLGEMVGLTRDIARRSRQMTPEEMQHAQERLEWLADEVFRAASSLEAAE